MFVIHTAAGASSACRRAARRAATRPTTQATSSDDRRGEQAEDPRRAPSPTRALADADEQRDEPAPRAARRRASRSGPASDRRLGDEDRIANAAITRDQGSQKSQWCRGARRSGPARTMPTPPPMPRIAEISAMRCGDPLARELVADDPEREREDAAAGALHDARDDHQPDRRRERRRAPCRARARPARRPSRFLPNMSPRRPAIGVSDRGAQQVGGEDPRGAGRRRVRGHPGSSAARARRATAAAHTRPPRLQGA